MREIDEWTPSKEPPKKTFEKKPVFIKLDKFKIIGGSYEGEKIDLEKINFQTIQLYKNDNK